MPNLTEMSPEYTSEHIVTMRYLLESRSTVPMRKLTSLAVSTLNPQAGDKILVPGFGAGHELVVLSHMVGSAGGVVGIEIDEDAIAYVSHYLPEVVKSNITVEKASVEQLSFDTGSFDKCLFMFVLQHVPNPSAAIQELSRVTKSGGVIVGVDEDWSDFRMSADPELAEIERAIAFYCAEFGALNGRIGAGLKDLFEGLGLVDIREKVELIRFASDDDSIDPFSEANKVFCFEEAARNASNPDYANRIAESDIARWINHLQELHAQGRFETSIPAYVIRGVVQ